MTTYNTYLDMIIHIFRYAPIEHKKNILMCILLSKQLCKRIVTKYEDYIIHIIYLLKCGCIIKYIGNQSPEMCTVAAMTNYHALKYIKHRSIGIDLAAVYENYNALKYIKIPTYHMCMVAIQKNPKALKYIKNQIRILLGHTSALFYALILYFKLPQREWFGMHNYVYVDFFGHNPESYNLHPATDIHRMVSLSIGFDGIVPVLFSFPICRLKNHSQQLTG